MFANKPMQISFILWRDIVLISQMPENPDGNDALGRRIQTYRKEILPLPETKTCLTNFFWALLSNESALMGSAANMLDKLLLQTLPRNSKDH